MEVEILDRTPGNVVVRTEGRRFPALAVQGDTFHNWVTELKGVCAMAQEAGQTEFAEELEAILEGLEERLAHYESVLESHGIEKPY